MANLIIAQIFLNNFLELGFDCTQELDGADSIEWSRWSYSRWLELDIDMPPQEAELFTAGLQRPADEEMFVSGVFLNILKTFRNNRDRKN